MFIPTEELIELVNAGGPAQTAAERHARQIAIEALRAVGAVGDLSSPGSSFLRELICAAEPFLTPTAVRLLSDVELYGVSIPYTNALPSTRHGRRRIVVFEGLQHAVRYFTDLIKILDRLSVERPGRTSPLEDIDETLALSLAGFSILSDAVAWQRPPAALGDMLGEDAQREVVDGYRLAIVFLVLHELAHLELGHLDADHARPEAAYFLIAPELMSSEKALELEADAFAMSLIQPEHRRLFAPSLIFLFGWTIFLQVFGGEAESHPLAVNRLNALVEQLEMPPEDEKIVRDWIGSQVENWSRLAGQRHALGVRLRDRIETTMPVALAYRTIDAIKSAVAEEHGLL